MFTYEKFQRFFTFVSSRNDVQYFVDRALSRLSTELAEQHPELDEEARPFIVKHVSVETGVVFADKTRHVVVEIQYVKAHQVGA